ncbi:MAG: hypothetical protein AAFP86_01120 [Planctomycetota bacterium]
MGIARRPALAALLCASVIALVVAALFVRSVGDAPNEAGDVTRRVVLAPDEQAPAEALQGIAHKADTVAPVARRPSVVPEAEPRTAEAVAAVPDDQLHRIRVVDPFGRGVAGVTVAWDARFDSLGRSVIEETEPTDADGWLLARQAARRQLLERRFRPADVQGKPREWPSIQRLGLAPAAPLFAGGEEPDRHPFRRWLDTDPGAGATTTLSLPEHGFVRLTWGTVESPNGGTIAPSGLTLAILVPEGERSRFQRFPLRGDQREIVVGPVPLGERIAVALRTERLPMDFGSLQADGPTTHGQTVSLAVDPRPLAQDLVAVRARFVDEERQPLAGGRAVFEFRNPETRRRFVMRAILDEDASCKVAVPRRVLRFPLECSWGQSHPPRVPVGVRVPRVGREENEVDVGEIFMAIDPDHVWNTLISGVVVDETGAPREECRGTVQIAEFIPRKEGELPRWRVTKIERVKSPEFRIREKGTPKHGPSRVFFEDERKRRTAAIDFVPGDEGVRLVHARGIQVQVQLDAEYWVHANQVFVFKAGSDGRLTRPEKDGPTTIEFDPNEKPPIPLEIVLRGTDWAVWSTEVRGDADLGRIDLRGALNLIHLHVLGAEGELPEGSKVAVRDAASGELVRMALEPRGGDLLEVLVPEGAGELVLECKGVGTARVPRGIATSRGATSAKNRFEVRIGGER